MREGSSDWQHSLTEGLESATCKAILLNFVEILEVKVRQISKHYQRKLD